MNDNNDKSSCELHDFDTTIFPEKGKYRKLSRADRRTALRAYKKGKITEDQLERYGIKKTDYSFVYCSSRKNGLSRTDSFYNALYIHSLYRFDRSKKRVPDELKNTFSHPKGWYNDSFYTWKNNFWSRFFAVLQRIPLFLDSLKDVLMNLPKNIKKKYRRGTEQMDNSFRLFVGICRGLRKTAIFLIPFALVIPFTIYAADMLGDEPMLEVYINGDYIGIVESDDVIISSKRLLEKNLSAAIGDSFRFTDEISYKFINKNESKSGFIGESELYSALYGYAKEYIHPGYGLYVDGVRIAVSESRAVLDRAVEDCAEQYRQSASFYSESENVKVSYSNNITITPVYTYVSDMSNETEIRQLLGLEPLVDVINADPEDLIYSVYYSTILSSVERNAVAGNEKKLTGTKPQSMIVSTENVQQVLSVSAPMVPADVTLGYIITKNETVEEDVPYAVEYIESENYLLGSEKIDVLGSNGHRIATYSVSYQNGEEISRELIEEEVIKSVQNRIIYVGTRIPSESELATTATGTFVIPYDNYLSSGYGIRTVSELGTRDFHPAWDIPGDYGDDIVASDGGVVSSVGYTSGYGLHVIIDHENGYETLYAHLSKSLVEEGDRIGQGSVIAEMGSSGRVTGVHVHFEIRKDGATVDPEEFLGYVEEKY